MNDTLTTPAVASSKPERIFARQLARELSQDEMEQVGGAMRPVFTGRSSTVCCDIDGTCDC
jgi:hypothetical protein